MPRPYMALRKLMLIMDWNQEDIGRIIARDGKARCCKYVSDRLCGKQYFDTYDGYAICQVSPGWFGCFIAAFFLKQHVGCGIAAEHDVSLWVVFFASYTISQLTFQIDGFYFNTGFFGEWR